MSESNFEYTLPGVLHFLQAEWRKFEREKNEWVIERSELKARIALLEGERRGVENLRLNLTKRIKMLEYALREERKQNTGLTQDITPQPILSRPVETKSNVDYKLKDKSRELLKSCLQEINYLTNIPTQLPLTHALSSTNKKPQQPIVLDRQGSRQPKIIKKTSLKKEKEEEEIDLQVPANVDEVAMIQNIKEEKSHYESTQDHQESLSTQLEEKFHLSEDKVKRLLKHANKNDKQVVNTLESKKIKDLEVEQQNQPKLWKPKVTIKGHLDSVRTVCFHPTEMIAASGSDDYTVKLWNLKRLTVKDGNSIKKGGLEEESPVISFRGHTNIITSVVISAKQNRIYSGSLDSTIRVWNLPSIDRDTFSVVDPSLSLTTYIGHTDAIWDFKLQDRLLASISADKTIKIWDTESNGSLLKTSFTFNGISSDESRKDLPSPTSLDFNKLNPNQLIVSFSNAKIRVFDIETGQVIKTLNGSDDSYDQTVQTQINSIVSHPSLPLLISGHEDRHIKFFDTNSGECIQTLSGHLDSITSIDINSNGTTLVSGGHDSSIRLWDIESKSCIQEFSAHRRKGNEGVHSVSFHPIFPWLISGGADGIVKIYHYGS